MARVKDMVHVAVEGETFKIEEVGPEAQFTSAEYEWKLEQGLHTLKVPMPGTVSKILVGEGEDVLPHRHGIRRLEAPV